MHNIPFAMRVRGTIETLKEEMASTFGTDEYVDWTALIKSLEETLEEMPEDELNEIMPYQNMPKIWTMMNWRSGDMLDHIDYLYWLELSWDMNQDMGSNEPQEESNVQEK